MLQLLIVREKLDLNDKSNWTINNAEQIADELGYASDEGFKDDLELFIATIVNQAKMNNFLRIVATGYFSKCKQEKK